MSERRWTEHHVITVLTEDGVGRYEYDVPMRELTIEGPLKPFPGRISYDRETNQIMFEPEVDHGPDPG